MISLKHNRLIDAFSIPGSMTKKLILLVMTAAAAQIAVLCVWGFTGRLASHPLDLMAALAICTVLSTAVTVAIIAAVLKPVNLAIKSIMEYDATGAIPEFDEHTQDEMNGLVRVVRNTIIRLDLARKEVVEISKVDALTGLLNRRTSEIRLQKDLARASGCGASYSLILIGMDDFKQLNARHNTAVGDLCLQHFAAVAGRCVRNGDWIGRWDGDKFMIGLWDASPETIDSVIARIRSKFIGSDSLKEAGLRVTASYGYASLRLNETENDLLLRVEAALRTAKHWGKNRSSGDSSSAVSSRGIR